MKKNDSNNEYFDCPSCGNPLIRSNRDVIKCKYCETLIVPQGYRDLRYREPEIAHFNKKRTED